jgi:hypothetical protein
MSMVLLGAAVGVEINVDGVVQDSKGTGIGGADVSIYVAGRKDPVETRTTEAVTGRYEFKGIVLSANFDIFYTHSRYSTSSVALLAEKESQHVAKVLYLKGEARPADAVNDSLRTVRQAIFLSTNLTDEDRRAFVNWFAEKGLWREVYDKSAITGSPMKETLFFLEEQQGQTQKLAAEFLPKK